MLIKKKRIRNVEFLSNLNGKMIKMGVFLDKDKYSIAQRIGFSTTLSDGETVLPSIIGPVTRRNADGYHLIHRDQPKETWYRTIEWHWKQWSGRGETEEMSDYVDVSYQRYPRTFILPYAIELTITTNLRNDIKYITSPTYNCDTNTQRSEILHVINLFLEIFNECYILYENLEDIIIPKLERLNWDILPPGEYPWEKRYEQVKPFIEKAKPGNQSIVKHRIEYINSFSPNFVAIGKAGFSGYLVMGFDRLNLYVFESVYTNNATYIFDGNWKKISQLTKKDILTQDLQKERIIHRVSSWNERINKLLG